jgi:ElaB/YqjD/DUF883 family membrane-anchored ribosome-binding protein
MVTRDPSRGDDPTRAMPTTGSPTTGGTGYNRQGADSSTTTGVSSTTYSPHTDVTGYSTGQPGSTTHSEEGMTERVAETAEHARERATEMADHARERAGEVLTTATDTVDAQRDTVAGGLDTVATQLRDRAEMIPGGERTTHIAQTAADRIEGVSGYVREHEVSDMMTDLETLVRAHPMESLAVALAAGFLVGRMFK